MDDSLFARFGYDPVRIFTHFHGQPPAPGGIARFVPAGQPLEVKGQGGAPPDPPPEGDGPVVPTQPVPAKAGREVAAAPAADGGGYLASAASAGSPLHQASPGPPPRAGEELGGVAADIDETSSPAEPEPNQLVAAWLAEHRDTIEAMARAGEAPQRPAPLPPPSPPPAEAGTAPRPLPYVERGDRWTRWKMAEFLRQLAATHSVSAAAKAVGMHRRSAYKLRARLKGQPFDIAWEAAFRHSYDDLAHAALELALEGEEVPHYHGGELKGTHRKRHPQLMVQLLKMRNRAGAPMLGRYGAAAEFWSENWQTMVDRIETGSLTWDDEHKALTGQERAQLDLPDEKERVEQIIVRNLPDEPQGR